MLCPQASQLSGFIPAASTITTVTLLQANPFGNIEQRKAFHTARTAFNGYMQLDCQKWP
jgi:hypothetical protein